MKIEQSYITAEWQKMIKLINEKNSELPAGSVDRILPANAGDPN